LDKYTIKLLSNAYHDLDQIYEYVAKELSVPETAINLIDSLEEAIISLEEFPYRGASRRTGAYKNKNYRQLFTKNFTILYRTNEEEKQVVIVTIKYSRSQF